VHNARINAHLKHGTCYTLSADQEIRQTFPCICNTVHRTYAAVPTMLSMKRRRFYCASQCLRKERTCFLLNRENDVLQTWQARELSSQFPMTRISSTQGRVLCQCHSSGAFAQNRKEPASLDDTPTLQVATEDPSWYLRSIFIWYLWIDLLIHSHT